MRAAHEAAAAGDQLRHGRAVIGQRSEPAPADRERPSSSGTSGPIRGSGNGAKSACKPRCSTGRWRRVFGWPLYLSNSPNKRTLYNFPDARQRRRNAAAGGVAAVRGRHRPEHADPRRRTARSARPRANRASHRDHEGGRPRVCGGFEIGVDVDQMLENGARYQDKRPVAKQMWATIMRALADVRAISEEQSYGQDPVRIQPRAR